MNDLSILALGFFGLAVIGLLVFKVIIWLSKTRLVETISQAADPVLEKVSWFFRLGWLWLTGGILVAVVLLAVLKWAFVFLF